MSSVEIVISSRYKILEKPMFYEMSLEAEVSPVVLVPLCEDEGHVQWKDPRGRHEREHFESSGIVERSEQTAIDRVTGRLKC